MDTWALMLQQSGIIVICFVRERVLQTEVSFSWCVPREIVGNTWSGYSVSWEVSSICWTEYSLRSHFCQSVSICGHSTFLSAQLFGLWGTMIAPATSLDP